MSGQSIRIESIEDDPRTLCRNVQTTGAHLFLRATYLHDVCVGRLPSQAIDKQHHQIDYTSLRVQHEDSVVRSPRIARRVKGVSVNDDQSLNIEKWMIDSAHEP